MAASLCVFSPAVRLLVGLFRALAPQSVCVLSGSVRVCVRVRGVSPCRCKPYSALSVHRIIPLYTRHTCNACCGHVGWSQYRARSTSFSRQYGGQSTCYIECICTAGAHRAVKGKAVQVDAHPWRLRHSPTVLSLTGVRCLWFRVVTLGSELLPTPVCVLQR